MPSFIANFEQLTLSVRPSCIININTTGSAEQREAPLISAHTMACPPVQDSPNVLHLMPVVDQGHLIKKPPYTQKVQIRSPVDIVTDSRAEDGIPGLFTPNIYEWGTSTLQQRISCASDSRIRGLSISNFLFVDVRFPYFCNLSPDLPINILAIGAPGVTYPFNNSIAEGAAIIGIDWERKWESNGHILGIVIGWVEQFLGWNREGMLARLSVGHVSFGDQFLREEVTTLRVTIRRNIVDTVGSHFEAQIINYGDQNIFDLVAPPPPGIPIQRCSLPNITSAAVHTQQLRGREDDQVSDGFDPRIRNAFSYDYLGN